MGALGLGHIVPLHELLRGHFGDHFSDDIQRQIGERFEADAAFAGVELCAKDSSNAITSVLWRRL